MSKSLTKKTRAVIIVHLYGKPGPIHEVRKFCNKNNLKLIEDCAQACGSSIRRKKIGSLGIYQHSVFILQKTLVHLAMAEQLLHQKNKLYINAKKIRQYGWDEKKSVIYQVEIQGLMISMHLFCQSN